MSRSGYSYDCDDDLQLGRWRGQVASAIRGKRGQEFLRDLVKALEAMPDKRLIAHELIENGQVCTLGAIGVARGIKLEGIDPHDHETLSDTFGIATQLVQEIENENDENCSSDPAERWKQMLGWAKRHLKDSSLISKTESNNKGER